MIEFKIFNVRVKMSFMFFAVMTFMSLIDTTGLALAGFIACIIHELAHILSYAAIRKKPSNVSFEATGIKLTSPPELLSLKSELFILSSGCLANFAVAAAAAKPFPSFAVASLTIGLFNLLPVYSLDGGKIIYTLLCLVKDPMLARKTLGIISFCTLVPLIAVGAMLFLATQNVTLLITSVYLLALLIFKSNDM